MTRRLRALVLACALAPALMAVIPAAGEEPDVKARLQQLRGEQRAAARGKDWPKAIEAGLAMDKLKPGDGSISYNLACLYSLSGAADPALEWLDKAVTAGFPDMELLEEDEDLDPLRGGERFKAIVARGWKLAQERDGSAKPSDVRFYDPGDLEAGKPAPLIIVLHDWYGFAKGLPGVWGAQARRLRAVVMAPQSPAETDDGGYGWTTIMQAESVVKDAIRQAKEKYAIDEKRIVLTGFGHGGWAAYGVGLRNPTLFRGVVPVAAAFPRGITDDHLSATTAAKTRFFVVVGAKDEWIGDSSEKAHERLKAAGVDISYNQYPDTGHDWPADRGATMDKALEYVLGVKMP